MTATPSPIPDVLERSRALQGRILPTPLLTNHQSPKDLLKAVRRHLTRAADTGKLASSIADIQKLLGLSEAGKEFTIYGARLERANFRRDPGAPHFMRDDGAWFDFLISGRLIKAGSLEILAYSCEVRLPADIKLLPKFVRFDLNPPGHANEAPGLRCHIHPGHDDLQVPAPFMHPLDILDFCVYGATWPEKLRS
jgi:hypothetical protein